VEIVDDQVRLRQRIGMTSSDMPPTVVDSHPAEWQGLRAGGRAGRGGGRVCCSATGDLRCAAGRRAVSMGG
jgi:hypothetical protein